MPLTVRKGVRGLGRSAGFTNRTQTLSDMEIIDENTKDELDWIWNIRKRVHLIELDYE
jgi:hypothetical protein